MRFLRALLIAALLTCSASAQGFYSHVFTATGSDVKISTQNSGIGFHRLFWQTSGTVSTCQVQLDNSSDGVSFTPGVPIAAQTCTSNGNSLIFAGNFNFVRITVGTLSGGGSINVRWEGYVTSPNSTGTAANTTVQRDANGRSAIGDPAAGFAATPQLYFDDANTTGLNVSMLQVAGGSVASPTGLNVVTENDRTAAASVIGTYSVAFGNAATGTTVVNGANGDAENIGANNPSLMAGFQSTVNQGGAGTVALAVGADITAPTKSAGTITQAANIRLTAPTAAAAGGNISILMSPDACTNASPAACGAAASGTVAQAAASGTLVVNTTSVTANSHIFLQEDSSLGTKLGVTCNTTPTALFMTVTARTAGTSFTITSTAPVTNPRCISFLIIN